MEVLFQSKEKVCLSKSRISLPPFLRKRETGMQSSFQLAQNKIVLTTAEDSSAYVQETDKPETSSVPFPNGAPSLEKYKCVNCTLKPFQLIPALTKIKFSNAKQHGALNLHCGDTIQLVFF